MLHCRLSGKGLAWWEGVEGESKRFCREIMALA